MLYRDEYLLKYLSSQPYWVISSVYAIRMKAYQRAFIFCPYQFLIDMFLFNMNGISAWTWDNVVI